MASKVAGASNSFKIVMLGDSSVGKTCLVGRFLKGSYNEQAPTIVQNFDAKTLNITQNGEQIQVRLQIWDTAGGEQYRSLSSIYFRDAKAYCLVYDSTNEEGFDAIRYWVDKIEEEAGSEQTCKFLVAAKIDLSEQEAININDASNFAKEIGADLMQTSAKDGTGVSDLFQKIAEKVYANSLSNEFNQIRDQQQSFKVKRPISDPPGVAADGSVSKETKKDGCC